MIVDHTLIKVYKDIISLNDIIISEATDRPTDKIFTEDMLICKMNVHKKLDHYLN